MGQAITDEELIKRLKEKAGLASAKPKAAEITDPLIIQALEQKSSPYPALLGSPPQGGLENFTSGVAKGSKAIAEGAAGGLGVLGDLQKIVNPYLGPLGQHGTLFPSSSEFNELFGNVGGAAKAGLESVYPDINLDTRPTSKWDEYTGNALRGMAAAVPLAALTGGTGGLAVSGAVGGVGAQAGKDLFEGNPKAQPWAELAGGLIGGGVGQGLVSAAERAIKGPPVARVARALGDASTLQEAGTHLQEQARLWRNQIMPARMTQAWAPIDQFMGQVPAVGVQNYAIRLNNLTNQIGGMLGSSSSRLSPSLIRDLNDMLFQNWSSGQRFPSWNELKAFRTKLGDALDTPELVESGGSANLRSLYGALTDDMKAAVASQPNGQQMLRVFDSANAESKRLFDFAEGPLSKIISDRRATTNDPRIRPEDAAARLLTGGKKGATDLDAIRREIPNAVDQLAAASLRLGPGQAGAGGWPKLTPEGKTALVPSQVSRKVLDSELPLNPSPTLRSGMLSNGVGASLGILAQHILGQAGAISPAESLLSASLLPWGAGGLIAANAAPAVINSARKVFANPALLRGPVGGAVAGSNELLGPQVLPPQPGL